MLKKKKELFEGKERSQRDFCMVSKDHDYNLEAFKMKNPLQILSYLLCQQLLAGLFLKMSASLDLYV